MFRDLYIWLVLRFVLPPTPRYAAEICGYKPGDTPIDRLRKAGAL